MSISAEQLTTLKDQLQDVYCRQDTLPKLVDDGSVPDLYLKDHYMKLRIRHDRRHAKHPEEKSDIELENLFEATDSSDKASKILITGVAGSGKSSLLQYIRWKWAQSEGSLWGDRFDFVFKVKLRDLHKAPYTDIKGRRDSDISLIADLIYSSEPLLYTECAHVVENLENIISQTPKERILFLLDAFDETLGVTDQSNTKASKIYNTILRDYKYVIMTTRPNAINTSKVRSLEFDRLVENQGFEQNDVVKYVEKFFGGPSVKRGTVDSGEGKEESAQVRLGQDLREYLLLHPNIKSLCEVPINAFMLCLIWNDRTTREAAFLSSSTVINESTLYRNMLFWLGKKYSYVVKELSQTQTENISLGQALARKEIKFLEEIAYESRKSSGGNEVSKELVESLLLKQGIAKISDVTKYGILQSIDKEGIKTIDTTHKFTHDTFQEYLCARSIKALLQASESDQAATAEHTKELAQFIAEHRHDQKYLQVFKFLAGEVAATQDSGTTILLVKRFWEAMTCNIDGIIETSVDDKVKLLMHLLGQSRKADGKFDSRIPSLDGIINFIDDTISHRLEKWDDAIIASRYNSSALEDKVSTLISSNAEVLVNPQIIPSILSACKLAVHHLTNRVYIESISDGQLITLLKKLLMNEELRVKKTAFHLLIQIAKIPDSKEAIEAISLILDMVFVTDVDNVYQKRAILAISDIVNTSLEYRDTVFSYVERKITPSFCSEETLEALRLITKSVPTYAHEIVDKLLDKLKTSILYKMQDFVSTADTILKIVQSRPYEDWKIRVLEQMLYLKEIHCAKIAIVGLGYVVQNDTQYAEEVINILKAACENNNLHFAGYVGIESEAVIVIGGIARYLTSLEDNALEALTSISKFTKDEYARSQAQQCIRQIHARKNPKKESTQNPISTESSDRKVLNSILESDIEKIGQLVTEGNIEGLIGMIKHSDGQIRSQVVSAIGRTVREKNPNDDHLIAIITTLQQMIMDKSFYVGRFTTEGLVDIAALVPDHIFKLASAMIESDSTYIREYAPQIMCAAALSKIDLVPSAYQKLKSAVTDDKSFLVVVASINPMIAMVRVSPELIPEILRIIQAKICLGNDSIRDTAISGIKKLFEIIFQEKPEYYEYTLTCLSSPNTVIRAALIKTISMFVNSPSPAQGNKQLAIKIFSHIIQNKGILELDVLSEEAHGAVAKALLDNIPSILYNYAKSADNTFIAEINDIFPVLIEDSPNSIFLNELLRKVLILCAEEGIDTIKQEYILMCIEHKIPMSFGVKLQEATEETQLVIGTFIITDGQSYSICLDPDNLLSLLKFEELVSKALGAEVENPLIKQLVTHEALFQNSKTGIGKAAIDYRKLASLGDEGIEVGNSGWHISLVSESNNRDELKGSFLLLEYRSYFGYEIICKVSDDSKIDYYIKHPSELEDPIQNTEFRKIIFGEMKYDLEGLKSPLYYITQIPGYIESGKIKDFIAELATKGSSAELADASTSQSSQETHNNSFVYMLRLLRDSKIVDDADIDSVILSATWEEYISQAHNPSCTSDSSNSKIKSLSKKEMLALQGEELKRCKMDEALIYHISQHNIVRESLKALESRINAGEENESEMKQILDNIQLSVQGLNTKLIDKINAKVILLSATIKLTRDQLLDLQDEINKIMFSKETEDKSCAVAVEMPRQKIPSDDHMPHAIKLPMLMGTDGELDASS